MKAIRIDNDELFLDIKSQATKEGYKTMSKYVEMLHKNRKIYVKQLGKSAK